MGDDRLNYSQELEEKSEFLQEEMSVHAQDLQTSRVTRGIRLRFEEAAVRLMNAVGNSRISRELKKRNRYDETI